MKFTGIFNKSADQVKKLVAEKKPSGFIYVIKCAIRLIEPKDWWKIVPLLILMSLSAFFNAIGITMVVPFIMVATSPNLIQETKSLTWAYHYFHFSSTHGFLISLGMFAMILLVVGNALNIYVTWQSIRLSYGLKYKWINTLFSAYLSQPYIFFLNNSSAELSKNILYIVQRLTEGIILQLFDFFAKGMSAFAILLVLIIVNPLPALAIMLGVGVIYYLIFSAIKNLLKKTNYHLQGSAKQTFKIVEEAFHSIKEVKLYQKEPVFLDAFEIPTRFEKRYVALCQGLSPLPRYILEIFAFGSVLLLVLYLLVTHHDLSSLLPILGFFVVSLYRIMPMTQNIFMNLSNVVMNTYAIEEIIQEYQKVGITKDTTYTPTFLTARVDKITHFQDILLQEIGFSYPQAEKKAISNITLKISAGQVIGFVGPSGAGKTTIVDIILGLLQPSQGQLIVNGERIVTKEKLRGWQTLLGYVPQSIILTNNSIAENIAFGVPPEKIDMQKVEKAAQFAQLSHFIDTLPERYNSYAGDRGIRLSGGQRQRIGIARALYHEPQVLIFDEATNALDGLTEKEIMQNIHALAGEKTIIIIAHRLQTIRACDQVYYIDNGQLVAAGKYDELVKLHEGFKKMVKIADGEFYSQVL